MSEQELREVDYQIARELFGWSAEEVDAVRWCEAGSVVDCANTTRELPRYSTDIAAAWLVVDAASRQSGDTLFSVARVRGDWGCRLGGTVAVCNPTAPVAICQAALKRLREKEVLASGASS